MSATEDSARLLSFPVPASLSFLQRSRQAPILLEVVINTLNIWQVEAFMISWEEDSTGIPPMIAGSYPISKDAL